MLRPSDLLLAFGPFAIYLLLIGWANLRRHPYVLAGARESALLGFGLMGFAVVGPMELFFPQTASNQFGAYVWLLLISMYLMLLVLWILVGRPRLVVYNISPSQLRAVLSELAHKLDPEARWAGDSLALPTLDVQLHLESFGAMRNVTLVATGPQQNYNHWRRLESALRGVLREVSVPRNSKGYTLTAIGFLILAGLTYATARDPQSIASGLAQLFRL